MLTFTHHDSWAYFAPRYDMKVIEVQPSDFGEPRAKDVENLIDQVRAEKVLTNIFSLRSYSFYQPKIKKSFYLILSI